MKIFLGKPKQPPLSLKKVREFIESHRGLHIVVEGDDLRGTIPEGKILSISWEEDIKEYVCIFETELINLPDFSILLPLDIIKFTNRTALILGENFWREERITNLNPPFEGPRYIIPNDVRTQVMNTGHQTDVEYIRRVTPGIGLEERQQLFDQIQTGAAIEGERTEEEGIRNGQ